MEVGCVRLAIVVTWSRNVSANVGCIVLSNIPEARGTAHSRRSLRPAEGQRLTLADHPPRASG